MLRKYFSILTALCLILNLFNVTTQADESSVSTLINKLSSQSYRERRAAIDALIQIGNSASPALIEALKDDSWQARCGAAEALGKIGLSGELGIFKQNAISALKNVVRDQEWLVRERAKASLKRISQLDFENGDHERDKQSLAVSNADPQKHPRVVKNLRELKPNTYTATLSTAISQRVVFAQFEGTGGSSGDVIRINIKKTEKAAPGMLVLTIPPGSLLRSSNPFEQSMVISSVRGKSVGVMSFLPETKIVLPNTELVTYILEAYCAEFEKDNPSATNTLRLGEIDPTLACVLAEGKRKMVSIQALQAAVWIVTDRLDRERIVQKFPVSLVDWQAAQRIVRHCKTQRR